MADLQLVTGTFRKFRATVRFHLGKIQQDVIKDDVVEFDGTTLKLGGVPHALPELRSAVKAGWLTPVESSVGDYVPQSANVKVRAAMDKDKGKTVSTEVQQDETFVGNARKASTTDGVRIETKAFNSTVIRDTEGDGREVGPSTKKSVPTGGDATEGEPVAKIKTSAKKSFTLDGSTSMNADADTGSDVTSVVEHLCAMMCITIEDEIRALRVNADDSMKRAADAVLKRIDAFPNSDFAIPERTMDMNARGTGRTNKPADVAATPQFGSGSVFHGEAVRRAEPQHA